MKDDDDPTLSAADAAGKDLVAISSTTLSRKVNTKFRNVAVPVITWEEALFDDLGLTGSKTNSDHDYITGQTQVEIANPGHPIAAGLSGTQTVYANPGEITWGRPNTNAVKIATVVDQPDQAVLFGYDTGKSMFGLTAPERRVGLFLKNTEAATLTGDSLALFDAALDWAIAQLPA